MSTITNALEHTEAPPASDSAHMAAADSRPATSNDTTSESQPAPEATPASATGIAAVATIRLSLRGRRASLVAGGDGRRTQRRVINIPAADIELVRVNAKGRASLILTPRITATPTGLLRQSRELPEYDLLPSDEQLLADARGLAALRHAYETQRTTTRNDAKEVFAQEFLRDASLRALVHPPPTVLRCVCRTEHGLLIFRDTDTGTAASVPVEAHRRFRADLANRVRANREQRERELAAHKAKHACMCRWIETHGTPDQRTRLLVGRLADAEMYEAIAHHVFALLNDRPRYIHNAHGDLVAHYRREQPDHVPNIPRTEVKIESTLVVHLSAAQWAELTSIQALLPTSILTVRRYRIYWSQRPGRHDPHLVHFAILAKYRMEPLTLVRSYVLTPA
jgi:hypothetical protein